jgi:hypothetical protein
MSLLIELGLNLVHSQQRTPKLDDLFAVCRSDQFKLVLGLAFGENGSEKTGKTGQPELSDFSESLGSPVAP